MFSSFSALRALLVAALCSSVLALPRPHAALPPLKRSLADYVDHLVYLDANKSSLYSAIEVGRETYGAQLDDHWGGLVVKSSDSQGSKTQINVESVSVTAYSSHGSVGFLQEDIEIDFYTTSAWPSSWPSIGSSAGVGPARIGIDIMDSKSVINQYLAGKWSNILDNWYYDLFLFYDWMNATSKSVEIDFAGIITTGTTLDWTSVFDVSSSQISQYGLPDLGSIKNQPYVYLRNDGSFYADADFWANGQKVSVSSQVSGASQGSVVVDVSLRKRWSKFPDAVVKALYGSLSGAQYYGHSNYGYYQFSCDATFSFWFTIGGVKYEVTQEALMAPNPWGDQCIGTIFTRGSSPSSGPHYDIVFGFQFLSSFYYRTGIDHKTNQPYMKLLPLPSPNQGKGHSLPSDSWSWSGSGNSGVYYSESVTYGSGAATTYTGSWPQSSYANGNYGWDNKGGNNGNYGGYETTSTSYGSGNGYTYGDDKGVTYGSGNSYTYGNDNGHQWSQATPSTSTVFTTTTIVHVGTTTVAWPASSTGYGSGYGSGGYSSSSASGYYGSSPSSSYGSNKGYEGENLAVAGNVAGTDDQGNDLNLPHGSIADQIKHCLPAIVALAIVVGVGLIAGLIVCLVRRRRGANGTPRPSAYRNLHEADSHAPVHVPLYGAEEGTSRYSDPYKDKE
ncbi:hypothetical protein C8Q79DRAFT_1010745 [Trametes meyenii]|nr:hypothetical protein C8Q79DRAFT_1010745 [Trametes meyenii]